jgi:FAD binding domain
MSFLKAHRVEPRDDSDPPAAPHLFDLNCDFAGISITDQMRRGHGIIVEALRKKIIGPDKPLLIIGAGVGGLMAAATAARHKVPTTVIEKKDSTLSVQANCPSRWVCPTQYSWPDPGWNKGTYPRDKRFMPFVWRRGLAAVETDYIRKELEKFFDRSGFVEVFLNITFEGYFLIGADQWIIPVLSATPEDPKFPMIFSMALASTGFGLEKTVVKREKKTAPETRYTGPMFWEVDEYEKDNPPLGISSGQPNVLISGSGDGALQDFLRIATRVDAVKVARQSADRRAGSAGALCWLVFKDLPGIERRIRRRVKDIEQRYQQEIASPYSRHPDRELRTLYKCCVHAEAHLEHLTLIKELCEEPRDWRQVVESLDRWVKNLRDEISIKIVYPCFHISPYYGLNRFMTLLVVAYAYQRYPDVQLLYPGTRVTEIVGAGAHAPPGDECTKADHCHGKDHRVFSAPAPDCLSVQSPISGETEFERGPYNALIVRHGINERDKVLSEDRRR